jgi:hypothetical protein
MQPCHLAIGRMQFFRAYSAIRRPISVLSMSVLRKWIPAQTRASSTLFVISEKLANVRVIFASALVTVTVTRSVPKKSRNTIAVTVKAHDRWDIPGAGYGETRPTQAVSADVDRAIAVRVAIAVSDAKNKRRYLARHPK